MSHMQFVQLILAWCSVIHKEVRADGCRFLNRTQSGGAYGGVG
jgi:hypothetical protein